MATAQVVSIVEYNSFPGYKKIKWSWKCTDAGVVTGSTTTNKYTGELIRFITDPVDGPTADYDVQILDSDSFDVLIGAGADRHTTTTQQVIASSLGCILDSKLTLEITSAGNAKSGIVYLYIKNDKQLN